LGVEKLRIFGSSSIGAFIYANNSFALAPPSLPKKVYEALKEALEVPVLSREVYNSSLLGVFVTGNSHGLILPCYVSTREVEGLKRALKEATGEDFEISRLPVKETAVANLILSNDRAAVVSPLLSKEALKAVSDVLQVEVIQRGIAGFNLVGTVAVVSNKGLLVNPLASDEEVRELGEIFGVTADVGTVNMGSPLIRSGLVVNDKGALVGDDSTGPELMRIQQVFFGT